MIIEHRTYTLPHGTMEAYLKRYEEHALPLQLKHLGRLLGFFVTEIGTLNQVVHLWAYDNLADREARRAALEADPGWTAFKRINAGSFVAQEVKILRATAFSPRLA
ncbi:NIPSNAP family protein [Muricoccus radiodurans]|uniref:NIPSNAP family protein n=1 Tax=Muricoccus radiodurans TaxID=2231721 RepID=UPI003CF5906A